MILRTVRCRCTLPSLPWPLHLTSSDDRCNRHKTFLTIFPSSNKATKNSCKAVTTHCTLLLFFLLFSTTGTLFFIFKRFPRAATTSHRHNVILSRPSVRVNSRRPQLHVLHRSEFPSPVIYTWLHCSVLSEVFKIVVTHLSWLHVRGFTLWDSLLTRLSCEMSELAARQPPRNHRVTMKY